MAKFWAKWMPKDVIAVIIVIGAVTLILKGHNSVISYTLLAIVAGYYGIDLTPFIKVGRNQHKKEGD